MSSTWNPAASSATTKRESSCPSTGWRRWCSSPVTRSLTPPRTRLRSRSSSARALWDASRSVSGIFLRNHTPRLEPGYIVYYTLKSSKFRKCFCLDRGPGLYLLHHHLHRGPHLEHPPLLPGKGKEIGGAIFIGLKGRLTLMHSLLIRLLLPQDSLYVGNGPDPRGSNCLPDRVWDDHKMKLNFHTNTKHAQWQHKTNFLC